MIGITLSAIFKDYLLFSYFYHVTSASFELFCKSRQTYDQLYIYCFLNLTSRETGFQGKPQVKKRKVWKKWRDKGTCLCGEISNASKHLLSKCRIRFGMHKVFKVKRNRDFYLSLSKMFNVTLPLMLNGFRGFCFLL